MTDAYEATMMLLNKRMAVTCIPVHNRHDEEDVAVVALEPNSTAALSLLHQDYRVRIRALLAVAIRSHDLLADEGLTYAKHRPH